MLELIFSLILISILMISYNWNFITNKIKDYKRFKSKKLYANKLTKLKLISSDYKEIENFIESNFDVLSDKTIEKLVQRIEAIKLDLLIK